MGVGVDGADAVVAQGKVGIVHAIPAVGLMWCVEMFHTQESVRASHPDASLSVAMDAKELIACAFPRDGGKRVGVHQVVGRHHRYAAVCAHPDVIVAVAEEAPHGIACQGCVNAGIVQNMVGVLVLSYDEESMVGADEQVAVLVAVLLPAPVQVTVTVGEFSALPTVVPLVVALTSPVVVLFNENRPEAVIA